MTTTELIGVPELAAALGVDQSTVHRRIERGAITPTVTVGKRPLFSVEDAQAIMLGPASPRGETPTKKTTNQVPCPCARREGEPT